MFRNYLAAALRNLVRNRLYTVINVLGLAVGLSAALLIALFVRDEFSYDKWMPGHERVYAVQSDMVTPTAKIHPARAPYITAGLLTLEFPQIEAAARFAPGGVSGVRHGDVEFREAIMWADPSLFDVLDLPAIAGNLKTALQDPDGLVLTRFMARKYFGRDNPVGETLEIDRKTILHVTAVLEDLPSNSHLDLGIIASGRNSASLLTVLDKSPATSGPMPLVFTYLRLAPGAAKDLRNALPAFVREHSRYQGKDVSYSLELVPMTGIHLHAPAPGSMKPSASVNTAYSAVLIALLIVAVAAINFVNLTTARAVRRAVEVGVRKASGAERWNLVVQFIGESVIYAVLSMALAMMFTRALLPSFNGFLERTIIFDWSRDPRLLGAMSAVVVTVGIFAGIYPALVLSRFSPANVLKGNVSDRVRGGRGRQILVACQFTILIVLALASTTIYRQAHFEMNDELRFDKDQMLVISTASSGPMGAVTCDTPFAEAVRALPGVRGAACASGSILGGDSLTTVTGPDGTTAGPGEMIVDFSFFDLYGLKPLAGRFFSRDLSGDVRPQDGTRSAPPSVVINETLSRALGFATPQKAVGQTIRWRPFLPMALRAPSDRGSSGIFAQSPETPSQIVGVVPDFAQPVRSQTIPPAIFWVNPTGHTVLNVKLRGNQVPETVAAIDQLWKQAGLPRPINRSFLDQQVENLYRDVVQLDLAMAAFAAVAVFVACLGLFGLAAFAAEQRTKEVGVRKALGASSIDILHLMLWEFSKPVVWASLIAWPIAYVIMHWWLEGFAERVDIGLWSFPIASALALAIAILTVVGHALMVARSQPAKALRYE